MIGIDLVEHKDIRVEDERFVKRVLSEQEYQIFKSFKSKKRQIEYVASRFAVKEALFKAYKSFPQQIDLKEITVLNNPKTRAPYIQCEKLTYDVELSITHTDNYSIAFVILHP